MAQAGHIATPGSLLGFNLRVASSAAEARPAAQLQSSRQPPPAKMSESLPPPVLPAAEVPFMHSGLAMIVAARDAAMRPASGIALSCRVAPDGRQVSVVVRSSQCETVLRNVRQNGMITFTCTQVGSNRTLQLKGHDARIGAVSGIEDMACIAAQSGAFVESVLRFDHLPEAVMRAYVHCEISDLAVISFTPDAVFSQTPGPNAGAPLT